VYSGGSFGGGDGTSIMNNNNHCMPSLDLTSGIIAQQQGEKDGAATSTDADGAKKEETGPLIQEALKNHTTLVDLLQKASASII
jgi:hypothetical protein